jgi:hypothetical protein
MTDERIPGHDFDAFHRELVASQAHTPLGRAAGRDVAGVPPIAFRLSDGRAYRLEPAGGGIRATPGDDAPTVVALDEAAWRDFAAEIATGAGLYYGERLRVVRGDYAALERWEPALRLLLCGRPIFDPATSAEALGVDPRRTFSVADSDAALRAHLDATGYLHVRGMFSRDEIARLSDLVESHRQRARPGDGRSWWARRGDGSQVACRLIYLGLVEPAIAALGDDPRIARLMRLVGRPLRPALDRSDGHSVVIKHADAVEGLSDLPWHRDCGLGGHPVTCPALNVGIQLDAATEATGRLHFVPGSWRYSCHRSDLARAPTVAIDTEPGDVTAHLGDVMHAAPPPTGAGPGRRALYVTGLPVGAYDVIPAGKSYNDVILARVGA